MIDGYKIVANTAAGRRRYMRWLIPQVVADERVDRYDIWVNTRDKEDIAFFRRCAEAMPKIRLVMQPEGVVDGIRSINAFYRACTEERTLYIKLDDDLLWLEPGFFGRMARFRLDHPEYFLVSPLVINNMLCTYVLQAEGKLRLGEYFEASCHHLVWSGELAAALHEWFLPRLAQGSYPELHCGVKPWALCRFSINSICWFGEQFRAWGGEVPGDDEEFLSCIKPTQLGLANAVNGDCLAAHFAFFRQRALLDSLDILPRYGEALRRLWADDARLGEALRTVDEAMAWVEARRDEILRGPDLYRPAPAPAPRTLRQRLYRLHIPRIKSKRLGDLFEEKERARRTVRILEEE